ncbi:hypothetical protein GLOTRDRAFT_128366 [Gloeophyllum trabeum ATCC 11539]|uniref:Xylanolytic transcriptional activator regulatory domain-containing protein n=1 Tax=Gloeophyllum trabeum (strain ATCC 11539 / FP-39264 / Madison 617) TaxID=670483 RepID=S7QA81_GLOTA|nr:uncharacterized protein GLOTRDRAFT_128366 [Gloeophyllum trabeum ATCC 11539]EPQ56422.1 hypothetical protein GLOTRDRAFT_128366 [Gloeophyllum trabeum ATCC 11539]
MHELREERMCCHLPRRGNQGSLTTGKGNRFVLANTEALHEKIDLLSNRVRQLEDALGEVYSQQSSHPHPLLSEELLNIKRPLEREEQDAAPTRERPEDAAEVIDAFGSLTFSRHVKLLLASLHSLTCLQNEEETEEDEEPGTPSAPLPADVHWLSTVFPFAMHLGQSPAEVRDSILAMLPRAGRAQQLVDLYYKHAAWMYTPIYETDFLDNVYSKFYTGESIPEFSPIETHRLAVLCMVLAMGALLDLDRPPLNLEASQYYGLGRAALSIGSVLEEPSIPAIQALVIMSHYMFWANIDSPRWAIMGLVMKLVQTVGLHRDSGKWQLSSEETMQRRSLLWEVYTYDSWQSLTFGRPPSFSMSHIDCQMAFETTQNERGEVEMSFAAWKHRFTSQCLSVVHEQVFGARGVSYPTLQKLDQAVRKFYVPPSLVVPGFGNTGDNADRDAPSLQLTMQRHIALAIKEISIFYMHRGFFARALEDESGDPLSSKYSPSVLAAYNSACSFVGLVKNLYSQQPELTQRMWFLFTHVFSCAIALGAIPSKCPGMALSPSALVHLKSARHVFEQISSNPRAAKVLPVLRKLDIRASTAMTEHRSRKSPDSPTRRTSYGDPVVKSEEDEWATLGGKTRLVSRKSPGSGGSSGSRSPETAFAPYSPASTAASPSAFHATPPPPPAPTREPQYAWDVYPAQEQMAYDPNPTIPQNAWAPETGFFVPDQSWPMAGTMDAGMSTLQTYPGQYVDYASPAYPKEYYATQGMSQGVQEAAPYETDVSDSWGHFAAQFNQV